MRITGSDGVTQYDWTERWAELPDTESHRNNGRTHGVAVTSAGDVVVFCQANPAVLIYGPDGTLKSSWGDRFGGAHGLTLVNEGGVDYLWLADQNSAEVVKTTLDGKTVQNIKLPEGLPWYAEGGKYVPTWVAVNPDNGDIWVTDGYGKSVIHRFDNVGAYIDSIDGTEGAAGAFKCPHGILFDSRKGTPELYIADRGNQRVQVYDGQGKFLRVFGNDILNSPCGFAFLGDRLYIPELNARLAVLGADDTLITYLGDNGPVVKIPGWPNHDKSLIEPGKFNSPHGMAAAPDGTLYVGEWIIGGRVTKLAPVA